jgi:hypothetical protein
LRTYDHAVGGLAGIGGGGCLHKIHRIGELHEAVSLGEVLVGESAIDRISRSMLWIPECGDPVSEFEAGHVRTDVRHDTGDLVAEYERKVCQHPRQGSVDETYIAVTDPGGPHVDDDLPLAGPRILALDAMAIESTVVDEFWPKFVNNRTLGGKSASPGSRVRAAL